MMFKAIDRLVRLSLLAFLVTLVGWAVVSQVLRVFGDDDMIAAAFPATLATARLPLVIIAGQTQQLPAADYISSVGGITLTGTPSSGAGDIELTTINGLTPGIGTVSSITCGTSTSCTPGSPITTSGTLNVSVPTATCVNGQAFTSNAASGAQTCGNAIPNDYPGTFFQWTDDWIYQQVVSVTGTTIGFWDYTSSGAGAQLSASGTTTRPGIELFATGTATSGRSGVTTATALIDFGSGTWDFQTTLGFTVLDDGTDNYGAVMGFSDGTASLDSTDGCYFMYDKQNTATGGTNTGNLNDLECWCSQNSTRTNFVMDGAVVSDGGFTTVAAPVAALTLPSTNIITMEVRMIANTEADFYVNGTKSCVITHNIPTGSARLTGAELLMIKSAGTTSRNMVVDQTQFSVLLNSARSP